MNARDYAFAIVTSETLAGKLVPPPVDLGFEDPGEPLRLARPGRPSDLSIVAGKQVKVPPIAGMRDPHQRARILHALANHELQAIELFAWALLAFPHTPATFRRGLVAILAEEQRHLALYQGRLVAHGIGFGDQPVTGHFWNKLGHLAAPIDFVCAMNLTFENANLDFAGDYAAAARACGDEATAVALDQVHADEIRHVHFGWVWLHKFATQTPADPNPARSSLAHPACSSLATPIDMWQAYLDHVRFPLGPHRARGARFDREARRRAGFDEGFIEALAAIEPTRPSGQRR